MFESDGHWPGWVDKRILLVNDYVVKPVTSAVKICAGYVRDFAPDPPTATEVCNSEAGQAVRRVAVKTAAVAVQTVQSIREDPLKAIATAAAGAVVLGACTYATGGAGATNVCATAGIVAASTVNAMMSCPPGRSIASCARQGALSGAAAGLPFLIPAVARPRWVRAVRVRLRRRCNQPVPRDG